MAAKSNSSKDMQVFSPWNRTAEDNMVRPFTWLQNQKTFKLEPYLGFLHSTAKGKPSLVCDFQELYRYLVDDFVIQYCRSLRKQDFIIRNEYFSKNRKGKREYLDESQTRNLVKSLNQYLQSEVEIPRIRMGNKQEIETLINEEALLLAMFLRNEKKDWISRIGTIASLMLLRKTRWLIDKEHVYCQLLRPKLYLNRKRELELSS